MLSFFGAALAGILGLASAANYTDFLPGAKAAGNGMSFVSIADDPYAIFYNPAGIANTPYHQLGFSMGRLFSPIGTLAYGAGTYLRPYEPIPTATFGGAYVAQRQKNSGDKDQIILSYGQELKLPEFLFNSRVIKVGGNFKFLNAEQDRGAGFGFGFDGGMLFRTSFGLSFGATLFDLTSNVGLPRAIVGLGVSYVYKRWLTVSSDLRVRSNLTEWYPGVEAALLQGLLKVRCGRGLRLDYVESLSCGFGLNYSPVIVDIGMAYPWEGLLREGGSYQLSVNYRFGGPPFAGSFVGNAATEAEGLRSQILQLEERRDNLRSETSLAENNRDTARGELQALEVRLRSLEEELTEAVKKKDLAAYELSTYEMGLRTLKRPPPPPPPPPPKPAPKKPTWPREHRVVAGDTLRTISAAFYGDPTLWEQIYNKNRDKIERGLPVEGAVLVIPEPVRP